MSVKATSIQLLRVLVSRSGMPLTKLAKLSGRSLSTLCNVLNGIAAVLSPKTTHLIEQAIGEAVWSDAKTFQYRRDVIKWAGFDPYASALWKIYYQAKPLGVKLSARPLQRKTATAAIEAAFDTAQAAKATKTAKSAKARKKTSLSPTFADTAIAPERTTEGRDSGQGNKTRARGAQLGQTLRTPTKREHGAPRP